MSSMSSINSGPAISSLGVGSGLDSAGIIRSLMAINYRPYELMTKQIDSYKADLSAFGQIQSLTSTMRDKASAIAGSTLWDAKATSSSDATIATAEASTKASAGSYSVTVEALASGQSVTSAAFSSSAAALSQGSLSIQMGSWSGSDPNKVFTAQGAAVPIVIGEGDTSLASIRDKINAAGAGVTATIINDANGARLSLTSSKTGQAQGFQITATETADDGVAATGLSALGFMGAGSPMALSQSASNAKAVINNVQVESATNKFVDVSDGLTLSVSKVSSVPTQINVTQDSGKLKTSITEFVTAFNSLVSYVKQQTAYNAETKTGGTLQGDSTANGVISQLRGVINQPSSASSVFSTLNDIGISVGPDGQLTTNTAKLDEALKNPAELKKLLATDGTTSASSGFMVRFRDLADDMLDTVDGSLATHQNSIKSRIDSLTDRQLDMRGRLDQTETRLRRQYEALDKSMASLNALSSYVSQQMASLMTR